MSRLYQTFCHTCCNEESRNFARANYTNSTGGTGGSHSFLLIFDERKEECLIYIFLVKNNLVKKAIALLYKRWSSLMWLMFLSVTQCWFQDRKEQVTCEDSCSFQTEFNYVWCPVLSMNNLILDICVGEAIAIEIHWTLYLLMFVTLLVWLSISNGERGLEEMLGWSLVCFGICGLQSIWSIQGEEIEAYAETLTVSFKNRRTILCVMIWWHLTLVWSLYLISNSARFLWNM